MLAVYNAHSIGISVFAIGMVFAASVLFLMMCNNFHSSLLVRERISEKRRSKLLFFLRLLLVLTYLLPRISPGIGYAILSHIYAHRGWKWTSGEVSIA